MGATLQALNAPDRSGHIADVTLGYDDARSYVEHPNYWGQTIGRYAKGPDGEVMIPALREVVESVDVPGRRIVVREVPGLTVPEA